MALRVRVCRVEDVVAGELRGFTVHGVAWPIMMTKVDDVIVATSSICPHEDVSLLPGELDGSVVTCPGHAYELDLLTGRCKHDPRLHLRRYKVQIVGDDVWIDLV